MNLPFVVSYTFASSWLELLGAVTLACFAAFLVAVIFLTILKFIAWVFS